MTYDIDYVFHLFDSLNPAAMIGFFGSFTAFMIYYVEALRVGAKHKTAAMPWQVNMWNMANDILFVAAAAKWLSSDSPTHHWLTVLQWTGMAFWFFMELAVHLQAIRWDLPEILPHVTNRLHAIMLYVAIQITFIIGYGFLLNAIDDPLVIIMITTTYVTCCAFNLGFLRSRGSRRGVSQGLVWSLVAAEVTWFFVYLPQISPSWASSPWLYLLGTVCTVLSVLYALAYQRAPKWMPTDAAVAPVSQVANA